nr:unnamed protein product [Spirometra erinaceieuropaei]
MADEYADLKQMLQQQLKLMEALTVKLSNSSMGQSSAAGGSQSVDHIAGSITEFLYDPQPHITFDSWYKRYEDLFSVDLAAQDDAWKVRLLLRKLGPAEHERYANFILPKNPREVAFKDTVETLSQIFGEQSSLFNTRFQCLQLCKRDSDDSSRTRALLISAAEQLYHTPRAGSRVPNADQSQARLCNDSEPGLIFLSPYGHIDQIASCYTAQASVQVEISAISLSALWRVAFPPGLHFPPVSLPKL